jgi:hypothetical protein
VPDADVVAVAQNEAAPWTALIPKSVMHGPPQLFMRMLSYIKDEIE